MPRKIAAGNWKMNGTRTDIQIAKAIADGAKGCDVVICPPATLIMQMAETVKCSAVQIGGQDCHPAEKGAHTGDLSAKMLVDAGASQVILGHSERRADHGESDELVNEKASTALAAGLSAIICVGETEQQRDAGETLDVIQRQLSMSVPDTAKPDQCIIAYEPVWAIGTGRTATPREIEEVHQVIREELESRFGANGSEFSILYGGSVKAGNALEIFAVPNVNGALVGGASLKAEDFLPIVAALAAA